MKSQPITLITNARVITANPMQPHADAVVIENNRIAFVGTMADAESFRRDAVRVIDAQGNTVMPGFIDSHYHLLLGSIGLGFIQVDTVRSLDDLRRIIHEHLEKHPDEKVISATQLQYDILPDGQLLNRHHLDSIAADRPLLIMSFDGHTVWANTKALEIAGVLQGATTPTNSEIVMGDDGTATGELREAAAYALVIQHFDDWKRSAKIFGGEGFGHLQGNPAHERELLHKGLRMAAQFGITSIHNMDGDIEQATLYAAMEDADELTLRVDMPFDIKPQTTVQDLDNAVEMRQMFQTDKVRAGRVKFFMDGVAESWTAFLLEPYTDRPDTRGDALFSAEHFNHMAAECDKRGLQIAVHAVGDAAVRRILDGYEYAQKQNGVRDSRHRIEHIEVVHPDDLPRFARLGVIAAMQPLHSPLDNDEPVDVFLHRVGRERWHRGFAWQYVRGAGARLVFGSDWSVVSPNPMLGMHAALNRKAWADGLPDHRQSLADTIASYTRDGAYAEFQEGNKGQLKAGMLADIVILSADIERIPTEQIATVTPLMTICDGRIVYEA